MDIIERYNLSNVIYIVTLMTSVWTVSWIPISSALISVTDWLSMDLLEKMLVPNSVSSIELYVLQVSKAVYKSRNGATTFLFSSNLCNNLFLN